MIEDKGVILSVGQELRPNDRLSSKSQKHLAEEERALPNTPDQEVSPPEVKLVDSPMSPEQMTKATNDQIIDYRQRAKSI